VAYAPALLDLGDGAHDVRLPLLRAGDAAAGGFFINPSLAWQGPRLFVAARWHRVASRPSDGARVWNSSIFFGELHPGNLMLRAPMVLLPVAALDDSPLSLSACAFAQNASAPGVLAAGAEDPRLALYDGAMLLTFNHLLRTPPNDDCPAGDVVRRVYVAPLSTPPAGALRPALLAPPPTVALSSQEKNWLVFATSDGLRAVYSIEPHVVIAISPTGAPAASAGHFTTSSGALASLAAQQRAALHGGANAVPAPAALLAALALPAGSRMLGAFHSLDARSGAYVNYAYLFNATPPFAVTHVSAPLPLTEAPPQPGAETPRGAHMAFLSGIVASADGASVHFAHGSSNVESRVLTLPAAALAQHLRAAA
jgi:hypothetical protein